VGTRETSMTAVVGYTSSCTVHACVGPDVASKTHGEIVFEQTHARCLLPVASGANRKPSRFGPGLSLNSPRELVRLASNTMRKAGNQIGHFHF
jgi:hypothetical protein